MSEFIARGMGLHYPPDRRVDLQRGLAGAAREFGIDDIATCVDWLLSGPPTKAQWQVLASHLTIGETYFFRDRPTLDALTGHILPELIRLRRGRTQRLRIRSAACCSGEEPYSLAILLHRMLPDLKDWHVTITATDINARFLHTAAAGIFREWSFRDVPAAEKARYFTRTADGRYAIIPEIRKMVTFAHLNLVEDAYPSLMTDTNAMDLIFCRNVLMYFAADPMHKVIGKLHRCLVEGGWLAVSPSEASKALFPQFATVNFPGAILFQKKDAARASAAAAPAPVPAALVPEVVAPAPAPAQVPAPPLQAHSDRNAAFDDMAAAQALYRAGDYAQAAAALLAMNETSPLAPEACSLLARALANQGNLAPAREWCERWIAVAKMDAAARYLRGIILLEQGDGDEAHAALQRALYLDHDFVLAHVALGNLARSRGKARAADKHFANALQLLHGFQPEEILPESDGLTAGRLTETLTSMTDAGDRDGK
ncbi:MAG TPA: CheR family methyltransferase [Burkholderiales bacterium]